MQNKFVILWMLIVLFGVSACTPEEVIETPAEVLTQTPFILVVTATPSMTPLPSQVPSATATASPTLLPPTPGILDRCVLRTDWETYEVQVGDTLSNISVRTNTTLTTLQLANCIPDANRIQVGQVLYVPQLPDDDDVIVEDIISDFSVNMTEAQVGETVEFSWEAESGTVIEIKNATLDTLVGSNLAATGTLSYTLPSDVGDVTELEFSITGVKFGDDGDIVASPYSVFITIVDEPEVTQEPEVTDEPEVTQEPEATDEP